MTLTEQYLSPLPGNPLAGLRRVDAQWQSLRQGKLPVPEVVQSNSTAIELDWDVVVCGGTLGILLGAALARQGWRVALVERGTLRGREQEWNISRQELEVFLRLGLLNPAELEQTIASEFNPVRLSFLGGSDLWVRDVLNVGVDPVFLLETLKQRFLDAGGQLFEQTAFAAAIVHPNGVTLQAGGREFRTRLLLDAMGHGSTIVRQARQGQPPDAVCLVVGTCATGFPANQSGDLIATCTPIQQQCQYFWEAFPARDGRTTYLFTYLDAHPDRPSLETLFEEYFRYLPTYQGIQLEQLQIRRALFGYFPCYQSSPPKLNWDRILLVGDSSGNQSPLSFGGFGAMVRHLERLTGGIQEALQADLLDRQALGVLQPYQPNLAVTWLFQRAMSVGVDQKLAPNQINQLLATVFQVMDTLGEPTLKPFLQDVVQFPGLFQTLIQTAIANPLLVLQILPQVGLPTLANWLVHYFNLAGYTALYSLGRNLATWIETLPLPQQYYSRRWLQALQYGSGRDYHP